MRLAFWRAGKDKAVVERAVSKVAAKRAELEPSIEAKPASVASRPAPDRASRQRGADR
jgi:hypothetical protein